ncbi:hypothetical protein MTR67_002404 [Solanum verrucosum]|uniref:DUF4283 domain-containing protein n=1 Tax=Solanum verrucosum TaxID=315347 RepID=A0AAF0PQX6_SOLVR|nr:hypothetical protein MTR67_002402 [Solanum verrucosum]WMV09019.1 hypothetical protein MTR67_002404 [Solanum verrucosum]
MGSKGMDLYFINHIIMEGAKRVQLQEDDIAEATEKLKKAMIFKPEIYYHNEGYFMVLFDSMEDMNEVLYSGPYTMNSRPIIIKLWASHFDLHDEVLKTIPLWIQFPNLPLNYDH